MKALAIISVVLVLGLAGCQQSDRNDEGKEETTTPHTLDKD